LHSPTRDTTATIKAAGLTVQNAPESALPEWLGLALWVCGRKPEARAVLEQLQPSERYILRTNFAHVHFGSAEFDVAFEWFDRAVEERDQNMMSIMSYTHVDSIRQNPRFTALLRKMQLA
jgi:hypothetical protein